MRKSQWVNVCPDPPPHTHRELSPGSFPSAPFSLEAEDETCSEEWPQAKASMNAQLNNPSCFKGSSLCASKAFYD